jgi:hypothetical protein
MPLDTTRVRQLLRDFDFRKLFIEELGWDRYAGHLDVLVDTRTFPLAAVAQKRGFQVFTCEPGLGEQVPDYNTRRRIDHQATKSAHEHLIIYSDPGRTTQVWQWVKREPGKPMRCREHTYHRDQPGDALIQKIQSLLFSFEEEEQISLIDVGVAVRKAFDVEKVTKRFYDRFKAEHDAFLKFLEGIPDEEMQRWYVSVMLNRLMFIYFIQKKGFLNNDSNYLTTQLVRSKQRGKDHYYADFLCPLFFEGFAKKESERSAATNQLLGKVPYLNGGLFLRHQIEELHGREIEIPDRAFERLFGFFEEYQWHLDERPRRADNEINPDVLGYIFEKYINQKQMGAYYTKEDITGYISQNTVIPFLFDAARQKCKIAFEGEHSVWQLLPADPDRYIYPAVKHGMVPDVAPADVAQPDVARSDVARASRPLSPERPAPALASEERGQDARCTAGGTPALRPLPPEIAAGLNDVSKRTEWNKPAPPEYALPTESWREVVARRKRYQELRSKLAAGEMRSINDLITYNLDIRQFTQDAIENCEGPELLRAFWHAIAGRSPEKSNERQQLGISILDPACGSGAFLFAALNALEPLYEACLTRMEAFLEDLERSGEKHRPEKYDDLRKILKRVEDHPNRRYFVFKSIILNNLFGVDIMEEATEICKLRLFLKLVAQIENVQDIEPLPDIDFNIRAGNSLVGYTTYEEVKRAVSSKLDFERAMEKIEEKAQEVERLFALFRQQQTTCGGEVTPENKRDLRKRLTVLEDELNEYLAGEYDISAEDEVAYRRWLDSHKPFHWFVEFYGIMKQGGFDAGIGNPPYINARKVSREYTIKHLTTKDCPDVYAWFLERNQGLLQARGRSGMIVPLSLTFSGDFEPCRKLLLNSHTTSWFSSYGRIPSALFSFDVRVRNTIHLGEKCDRSSHECYSTRLHRWFDVERPSLFQTLQYAKFLPAIWRFRIPKVNSDAIARGFESLFGGVNLGAYFSSSRTSPALFFKKTAYNWITCCKELPPCYDADGHPVPHTKFAPVYFPDEQRRDLALLILNGKLMFAFWCLVGDDFDVTQWMLGEFPIDLQKIPPRSARELVSLVPSLEDCMRRNVSFKLNAGRRVGTYNLAKCRRSTDVIDRILAVSLGIDHLWDDIELLYEQVVRTDFSEEDVAREETDELQSQPTGPRSC